MRVRNTVTRTELLCDYDGEIPCDFAARLEMVARVHRLRVVYVRFDKTRHGYHAIVGLSNVLGFSRIVLLQALLGSDWKRETFNSQRALIKNLPAFWRQRRNVLYSRHYRTLSL